MELIEEEEEGDTVVACITGCEAEAAEAVVEVLLDCMPVDGGGIPYSIVDVVTVLAVDPGRLLTLTLLLLLEDILVTVEAAAAVADAEATGAEAVGAVNSVVPEESVCICS